MWLGLIKEFQRHVISGLHPQSHRRVARKLSARVSHTLRSAYFGNVTLATT